jgi:ribosome-associated translation inhibitor RaiA
MALEVQLETRRCELSEAEVARIRNQLRGLERRLEHFPEPTAMLVVEEHEAQRRVTVELRVQLGPLAGHLISHQTAETPDRAVRLAVDDVERQLERRLATQRGQPTFGVPSRRLPEELRPRPPKRRKS